MSRNTKSPQGSSRGRGRGSRTVGSGDGHHAHSLNPSKGTLQRLPVSGESRESFVSGKNSKVSNDSGYVDCSDRPTSVKATDSGSKKTYADTPENRKLGRVGKPHGSMTVSKTGGVQSSVSDAGHRSSPSSSRDHVHSSAKSRITITETCMDKSSDRKQAKVGSLHGKSPSSAKRSANTASKLEKPPSGSEVTQKLPQSTVHVRTDTVNHDGLRVYKDNKFNRQLGRVGMLLGTMVYSRKTKGSPISSRTYANNAVNRAAGRVGKPLGSQPICRKVSNLTRETQEVLKKIQDDEITDGLNIDTQRAGMQYVRTQYDGPTNTAVEAALCSVNRKLEELLLKTVKKSKTSKLLLTGLTKQKINFDELKLGKQIGQGGFGNVFFATWKETPVAVKMLRNQHLSEKRLQDFTSEIITFCRLDHPNIVKFLGACVMAPNLAIVMEYMQMSLFEALHIDNSIDFSDDERLSILRQTSTGLQYLHNSKIAHCDLKSQNILLRFEEEETIPVKLTDFGLSMVRSDSESSSQRAEELVRNVGTPKYSAPEILRGEDLSAGAMMKSDIYALALIFYEVLYQAEPFYNMTYTQLQKQVGKERRTPDIPETPRVNVRMEQTMKQSWNFDPSERPQINDIVGYVNEISHLYQQ